MIVIRDPDQLRAFPAGWIRTLVERHLADLSEDGPYDPAVHGFFVVVEPGDTADEVEQVAGCALRESWTKDSRFGDVGFLPRWEWLEHYPGEAGDLGCFEMVCILDDSGLGVVILLPDVAGLDPELDNLCRTYATAGLSSSSD